MALLLFQAGAEDNRLPSLVTGAGDYLRVMLVLAAILILAYAAMRYIMPRMAGGARISTGALKVVARLPLETRKNLYVVQAGAEVLLIGTSETQVQLLTVLDPAVVDAAPPEARNSGAGLDFKRLFKGAGSAKGE